MTKHRSHSAAFKRQVAQEFLAGETLHGLSQRHDISRQLSAEATPAPYRLVTRHGILRERLADVLTDALRATTSEPSYTFWDFQAGAWRRNAGIRIDHLMLSPQAADRLEGVTIHKDVRGWDKPSDHVPVEGQFTL